MIASIFLDSGFITPSLRPSAQLIAAVKGIALSEGIYDIDLLLETFPLYRDWFIEDAFGPRQDYSPFNVSRYTLRSSAAPFPWLILHSKADELINEGQSQLMYDHLRKLYGEHAESAIFRDFDSLREGHDEILRGDEYPKLIQQFVVRIQGSTPRVLGSTP